MNPKRLTASTLAIVAGIVTGVSMLTAWWSASLATADGVLTVSFLPGDSLTASGQGYSGSATYSSLGWGQVGGLYEGILAFGIVAMILSFIGGVLGLLWSFGKLRGPSKGYSAQMLMVGVVIVSLAIVVLVPVVQPATLSNNSNGTCQASAGSGSPCSSFWGSVTDPNGTSTWGADVGWYLEVGAIVLLIAASVAWELSRNEPWVPASLPVPAGLGPDPQAFPAPDTRTRSFYPPGGGVTAAEPSSIPPTAPRAERYCPSCGYGNPRAFAFCAKCGNRLPPPPG